MPLSAAEPNVNPDIPGSVTNHLPALKKIYRNIEFTILSQDMLEPIADRLKVTRAYTENYGPINWDKINREAQILNQQVKMNQDGKISTNVLYSSMPSDMVLDKYLQKQKQKFNYLNKEKE